jgi:3',5'-cyclic AMP phosphodiesterase CpdA
LTFVHLSDTHLHADPTFKGRRQWSARPTAEAVIRSINAQPYPIDFVLHTGDVGNDPLRREHYDVLREDVFRLLRPPLKVIAGNHDHRVWLREAFHPEHAHGYYTFEANGAQIVCLDTAVPYQPYGEIDAEQMAWLTGLCEAETDQPLVVALHHHPLPLGAEAMDSLMLRDGDALHRVLVRARHRLKCVLFGHIHEQVTQLKDGVLYASTLSTWYQSRTWHGQSGDFVKAEVHTPGYTVVSLLPDGSLTMRVVRVPFSFP